MNQWCHWAIVLQHSEQHSLPTFKIIFICSLSLSSEKFSIRNNDKLWIVMLSSVQTVAILRCWLFEITYVCACVRACVRAYMKIFYLSKSCARTYVCMCACECTCTLARTLITVLIMSVTFADSTYFLHTMRHTWNQHSYFDLIYFIPRSLKNFSKFSHDV